MLSNFLNVASQKHGDTVLLHTHWCPSTRFGLHTVGPSSCLPQPFGFISRSANHDACVFTVPGYDLISPKSQLLTSHETEMFIAHCYVHLGSILR